MVRNTKKSKYFNSLYLYILLIICIQYISVYTFILYIYYILSYIYISHHIDDAYLTSVIVVYAIGTYRDVRLKFFLSLQFSIVKIRFENFKFHIYFKEYLII